MNADRIGFRKDSSAKVYTTKQLNWTIDSIKILGIDLYHEEEALRVNNYQCIDAKIRKVMNAWTHQNLSLLGEIIMINSLIDSLFVYKMNVLPLLCKSYIEELETCIRDFFWKSGTPKIALKIIQSQKECGGLKLFDLKQKEIALKVQWVKTFHTNLEINQIVCALITDEISPFIWQANLSEKDIKKMMKPNFWRDVTQHGPASILGARKQ